ncbi:diacylglycerol/lipid kinase family protein [Cellulomonas cellasea]|uniref:Diacylglycerol kinase n=2 Tax=Cellulomonas cellasea TaxID=43670 RepID=A0A0A0B8U7_9CELL|nr:diacylglycerol kinase family protein [Cellulomonas cellasea]KGM02572.1 diacylglycerol kinase [Cellulomonas cellasea DSM 20118]GEA87661.1 diacylglycerol kinase [Cellulomonas cellasea]
MTWEGWLALAAALIATVSLGLGLSLRGRQREMQTTVETARAETRDVVEAADLRYPLVAFVANPSKPDVADLRDGVVRAVTERGYPEPLWIETSVEDPGVGQTREAVEQGAKVVVAVGGDGTVRAVAEGLVGTGVPMALLPSGTGNLLARNLDIPVADIPEALRIALAGQDKTIDVGWLRITKFAPEGEGVEGPPAPPGTPKQEPIDTTSETTPEAPADQDHIFLVIAGIGFDAAMVADTDDTLKARVGWMAYFVSGIKHLHGRRLRTMVRLDDHQPTPVRLRSLLIGNCGKLPGGITLLPDAVLDDGWLDIAAIDTRGGVAGWAQLLGEVALQGVGVKTDLPNKIGRIDHARARKIRVRVSGGEHVQVDGDLVGRALELTAHVDKGALVVRVPSL